MLGTLLADRFELFEQVGQGHLGIVYKARSTDSGEFFAVKVLQKEDQRALQRFEREARAASQQDHPNIVRVFDIGTTDNGRAFIVMEFISGVPLRLVIRNEAPLSVDRIKRLFSQICDALTHLHQNGVVHRDLKPANIMIIEPGTMNERVKLVDFGLAKHIDPDLAEQERVTLTGHVTGTPAYMSPEQCLGVPVDARSDIYSLGCILFRACTGLPPVMGASARDTMNKQVAGDALSIDRIPPHITVSEDIKEVLRKALKKNPDLRYQTAEELKRDILGLR
ncbi:MAG: serine/threonine protein kinase [Cyanobacteria bacterium]|nr:serine/threonine protein kinase [Cyanobacteriota bacterium]